MMMEKFETWVAMGGYGAYIWSVYAAAFIVVALLIYKSWSVGEKTAAALQKLENREKGQK